MAESSSESKRPKPERKPEPNDDRISSLPNAVLLHIMSFLPTIASVRTSLLSRRWRHLWKHLQVFDFDDEGWGFVRDNDHVIGIRSGFAAFVNEVLALRKSRDIRKFRLKCALHHSNSFGCKSVTTWIRAAIGPHLEELHLTIHDLIEDTLVLPHDIFVCTKLKSLKMFGGIRLQVPSTVRLLSLKTFCLDVHSIDFIDLLLSGCPVVETLDLFYFFPANVTVDKVIGPSTLKKLTMGVSCFPGTNLKIYAPSLEYLNIIDMDGSLPSSLSIENFHNMIEAKLDMCVKDESLNIFFMLLRAICRTKTLVLSHHTTECLLRAPSLELPQFYCLVNMELILPWFSLSFLLTMLQQCNMLQVLSINNHNYKEVKALQRWSQPTGVPDCLVSHLNFFKFEGYKGNEDELAFFGYILRNGLVLETMIIHDNISDLEKRDHIRKELSDMPRGSNICQLRFI